MIDQTLMTAVQYALLEPPTGGLSWLSDLWTKAEMDGHLALTQQQLLKSTHLLIGLAEITTTIGQERYTLPDDWLATALVLWGPTAVLDAGEEDVDLGDGETAIVSWADLDAAVEIREVLRADMHQADLGHSTWETTPGRPIAYSDADTPTRTIQLMPAPDEEGTLYVLYVPHAHTKPLGNGEPLHPPDEWCLPVLKYDILAAALSKIGRGQDQHRARYCQWRGRLGVEVTHLLLNGMG
jgi:hypothetical protein